MRPFLPFSLGYWSSVFFAAVVLPVRLANAQTNAVSMTIDEAYEHALATDQSIAIALAETRKAKLLTWSAAAKLGPQLTGNAGYSQPQSDITSAGEPVLVDTRSANITLQQPLLDLTVFAAYRAGKLTIEEARLTYRSSVRTVLFGVTQAYYEVLKQQSVVAVSEQTLTLAREQLALAERRYNVGVAVKSDMLRARVQAEQANRDLIGAQNALQNAHTVLDNVLNLGADREIAVSDPPAHAPSKESLETLLNRAYECREDFLAGRLAIEERDEEHNVVRAEYGPRLFGQFTYQWIDPETQSEKNDFWLAAVTVQIPFFTGGQREVDLKRTTIETGEAKLRQETLAKSIQEDVRAAWLNLHALEQTLAALRAQLDAAEESYKDLQSQYRAGSATSLDVMSALNDLNSARKDLITQTYDYQIALQNLERVTGVFQNPLMEKLKTP